MKKFILDNWFRLGLLIILFSIGMILYQALVVIPRDRQAEASANQQLLIDEEKDKKQEQADKLAQCFNEAAKKKSDSIIYWESYMNKRCVEGYENTLYRDCLKGGVEEEKRAIADEKQDRAECIKIYPQN